MYGEILSILTIDRLPSRKMSKLLKANVSIENKSKSHHRRSFDLVEQVQWYPKVKVIFMGLPIEKSYFSFQVCFFSISFQTMRERETRSSLVALLSGAKTLWIDSRNETRAFTFRTNLSIPRKSRPKTNI